MCSPQVSWARLLLPFQPPGASLSRASIQLTGRVCKSWMHVPCGRRRSSPAGPSPDNPSQPTWTLALGTTFYENACAQTAGAAGLPEARGTQVCLALHRHLNTDLW